LFGNNLLIRKFFALFQRKKGRRDDLLSKNILNVFLATIILLCILLTGTVGYVYIEGWSPLDSLWMTVITMSTVGFGEVAPMHPMGRILTIMIIISTIMVGGYAMGNIGAFIFGGEVIKALRGRRLERDLENLKNHTILVGYGRVGKGAATEWAGENLVVIESNSENAKAAMRDGFKAIIGDSTQDHILRQAGIERARAIMIATGHVADNVLITLTAREMKPDIIISARGDEPSSEVILKRAGADRVVLPNRIGGRRMAAFIRYPAVVDFLDSVMHSGDLSLLIQEFVVCESSALVGKTLKSSDIRGISGGALIMAIKKKEGSTVVAPPHDYKFRIGDTLITLGTDRSLKEVSKLTRN